LLILACCLLGAVVGCGEGEARGPVKPLRIGLMITPKGLNDKGFNDLAFAGLKAAERKHKIQGILIEPATMKDLEASLRFFAGQEFDAIIAVGMAFGKAIRAISNEHPTLPFFVIDSTINEGRIRGISFREEEGSFLCGVLAASMAKSGKIGFVGGMRIEVIDRFAQGYRQGAQFQGGGVEVVERYLKTDFSGFNDPDAARNAAAELFDGGCDVVFHAAGASGLGVISAAAAARKYVIGVDMNQDSLAPGLVLTSMMKRVDRVVEDTVRTLAEGRNPDEIRSSYGMADGAVDLTDFQFSRREVGEERIEKIQQLKREIIAGSRRIGLVPFVPPPGSESSATATPGLIGSAAAPVPPPPGTANGTAPAVALPSEPVTPASSDGTPAPGSGSPVGSP